MNLSPVQEKIVGTPGNLIVKASAGTGKTHTMVNKIVKDIGDNHTHKAVAAITFTIKAAQEIKDRLSVDTISHFIGTNNSFAIEEIIKPFMKDVYGDDYDTDMSTDYGLKVDTFQLAVDRIKNEGISATTTGMTVFFRNSFITSLFVILTSFTSKSCCGTPSDEVYARFLPDARFSKQPS